MLHSALSDWLVDETPVQADPEQACRAMRIEAGKWVRRVPVELLADEHEFGVQAHGLASRLASQHHPHRKTAYEAFMAETSRLRSGEARVVVADLLSQVQQIIASPDLVDEASHLEPTANTDGSVTVTWRGGPAGFGLLSLQMAVEDAGLRYEPASSRDKGNGSAIKVMSRIAGNDQSGYGESKLPPADEGETFDDVAYPEGWIYEAPAAVLERSSDEAAASNEHEGVRRVRAESFPWDKDEDNDDGEDDETKADKAGDDEEDKADAKDAKPWEKDSKVRPLSQIAAEIVTDWPVPAPEAKPYLDAMGYLGAVSEPFGDVTGRDVVSYFIANSDGWTGKTAMRLKTELCYLMGREHARIGSKHVAAAFTGDDGQVYTFGSRYAIWTNQGGVVWEGDDLQDGLAWAQSSLTNQGDPMAFEAQVWENRGNQAMRISTSSMAMLSALRILVRTNQDVLRSVSPQQTGGGRRMAVQEHKVDIVEVRPGAPGGSELQGQCSCGWDGSTWEPEEKAELKEEVDYHLDHPSVG